MFDRERERNKTTRQDDVETRVERKSERNEDKKNIIADKNDWVKGRKKERAS